MAVFTPVKALFLPHEGAGIFGELLANSRMLLQKFLQRGMVLSEFVVLHKRRIFTQLLGNFGVPVEKLIESCELRSGGVLVPRRVLRHRSLRGCRHTEPAQRR